MSQLFHLTIRSPEAGPLCDYLRKNPELIGNATFKMDPHPKPPFPPGVTDKERMVQDDWLDLNQQGVAIVYVLQKKHPDWLAEEKAYNVLFKPLVNLWKVKNNQGNTDEKGHADLGLSPSQLRTSKQLLKCFVNYLSCSPNKNDDVSLLFYMLFVFTYRSTIDYTFLKNFYEKIATTCSAIQKRYILARFLTLFTDHKVKYQIKLEALQILILPLLEQSFLHCHDNHLMLDNEVIGTIVSNMIQSASMEDMDGGTGSGGGGSGSGSGSGTVPGATDGSGSAGSSSYPQNSNIGGNSLIVELLLFATLFVKYLPDSPVIGNNRKNLIRFAWHHLKSEDPTTKMRAYALLCHFIVVYQDTPQRIILQVFLALLRHNQPESRNLVRRALDILTPHLPHRFPMPNPSWIVCTKKLLIDEGHSVPQLIHILHLITRHPDLFYEFRGQFVPHMIPSLLKIGAVSSGAVENKVLALDIVELLINWELKNRNLLEEDGDGSGEQEEGPVSSLKRSKQTEGAQSSKRRKLTTEGSHPFQAINQGSQSADATGSSSRSMSSSFLSLSTASSPSNSSGSFPAVGSGPQGDENPSQQTPSTAVAKDPSSSKYNPPNSLIEIAITFLIRVAISSDHHRPDHRPDRSDRSDRAERREGENLSQRALSLLRRLLELFPDFQVKLSHFESLADPQLVKASLRALDVVFQVQLVPFVKSYCVSDGNRTQTLQNALMVALASRDETVVLSLCSLLKQIAKEFSPDPKKNSDVLFFFRGILNGIEKQLTQYQTWKAEQTGASTLEGHAPQTNSTSSDSTSSTSSSSNSSSSSSSRGVQGSNMELQLCCTLKVLLALSQEHPEFVDRFYPTIMSILQTKCYHLPRSAASGPKEQAKVMALDYPLRCIRLCLELLALRPKINECKEQLNHCLNELIDRTNHPLLILDLLNLLRWSDGDEPWLSPSSFKVELSSRSTQKSDMSISLSSSLKKSDPMDTNSEDSSENKNGNKSHKHVHPLRLSDKQMLTILTKLSRFGSCGQIELEKRYLRSLYDVLCSEPSEIPYSSRMELELHGMCSHNNEYRNKFLDSFCGRVELSLMECLEYIFKPTTWEPIGRYYWIRLALAKLLTVVVEEQITLTAPSYFQMEKAEETDDVVMSDIGGISPDLEGYRQELFNKHMEWSKDQGNANTKNFMTALRNLGVFDKLSAQVIRVILSLVKFFSWVD